MSGSTSVHDQVIAWAEGNISIPAMRQDFIRQSTRALIESDDCFFAIGPKITREKKPYLACFFARRFFTFALTGRQARNLGAVDGGVFKSSARFPSFALALTIPLPIEISRLEVDGGHWNGKGPLAGKAHYETLHHMSEPTVAACLGYGVPGHHAWAGQHGTASAFMGHQGMGHSHMGHHGMGHMVMGHQGMDPFGTDRATVVACLEYELKGRRTTSYSYSYSFAPLASSGVMPFSFSAIRAPLPPAQGAATAGWQATAAAFFRFVAVPNPQAGGGGEIPISNPLGVLLDLDGEA